MLNAAMAHPNYHVLVLIIIAALILTQTARGATIISNLPSSQGNGTETGICNNEPPCIWGSVSAGVGFIIPQSQDFVLSDVQLSLIAATVPYDLGVTTFRRRRSGVKSVD